ncbi:pilus assembly FimT family protein [Deinococcus yavapaiensis]|uniref:Pilin/secretion family protein with methylation motif n=1 Tax=Deinococcus yavapaiensis KR-236 TaxID=694435 RepID=A0A318S8Y7_9DEIO|nr:prepilin-type N-terminal cleavage/methylation domain-containing protein [Deinococcus yavapaiensis]PYE54437.1 pilin/secretion family protein with methylation motif [Deinococcus yavapaiensis KR-236]
MRQGRDSAGFTLLEALVVCAILGVVLGVGFFVATRAVRQGAVREAAFLVASDLRAARFEAVRSSLVQVFSWPSEARETVGYTMASGNRSLSRVLPSGTRLVCVTCPVGRVIVTYTPPYAELAAAIGVVLRVEGVPGTRPLLVKIVGITGKVMVTGDE